MGYFLKGHYDDLVNLINKVDHPTMHSFTVIDNYKVSIQALYTIPLLLESTGLCSFGGNNNKKYLQINVLNLNKLNRLNEK